MGSFWTKEEISDFTKRGVDLSLLRQKLEKTPTERVLEHQELATVFEKIRGKAGNGKIPRSFKKS